LPGQSCRAGAYRSAPIGKHPGCTGKIGWHGSCV
jgi:hypothetical protein